MEAEKSIISHTRAPNGHLESLAAIRNELLQSGSRSCTSEPFAAASERLAFASEWSASDLEWSAFIPDSLAAIRNA